MNETLTGPSQVSDALDTLRRRVRDVTVTTSAVRCPDQHQVGYFVIDREGRLQEVNDTWLRMHGHTSSHDVLGRPFWATVDGPDAPRAWRYVDQLLRGEAVAAGELSRRRADGEIGHHVFSADPIRQDGTVIGAEGFLIDITERKLREKLLREDNALLSDALERERHALQRLDEALEQVASAACDVEASNRSKSEFLASMSHEVRTPMTAILGFVEVLRDELLGDAPEQAGRADARNKQALDAIQRNGEYLLTLINDILDLSRIDAGRLDVEPAPFEFFPFVGEVQSLMEVQAAAGDLSLRFLYVGPVPEVIESDSRRLKQVLINLIGNAVKFTERGEVRVEISLVRPAGAAPLLQFDVVDSGIGMSADQVARLFRPFSPGSSDTARKLGGTGLGLAISKQLVDLLGGEITVSSQPGVGSTFRLTIPPGPLEGVCLRSDPAAPTGHVPESDQATATSRRLECRILVAEDDLDSQGLFSHLLHRAGADVVVTDNGERAVNAVSDAADKGPPFDIVLMDMQMPVMDGYVATRRLREQGFNGPVIALTAHAMSGDRAKCLAAGCDAYLSKPIERCRLIKAISQHLSREPAAQQSAEGTS